MPAHANNLRLYEATGVGAMLLTDWKPDLAELFPITSRRCPFAIHACVVERAMVVAAGGFDETLVVGEDWDLWQRLARSIQGP